MDLNAAYGELTNAIKRVSLVCVLSLIFGFLISKNILNLILSMIPNGIEVMPFSPMETFNTVLSISIGVMLIISIPYILYELIRYAKPGLYKKEAYEINNILLISSMLFIGGSALSAYLLIFKGLEWFVSFNADYGFHSAYWSLENTVSSIVQISILSGICFLFPIPLYYAVKMQIIDGRLDITKRMGILVGLLIITGVIIPDATLFSQIGLSLPIYLLAEGAIYLGRKNIKTIEVKAYGQ